MSPSMIEELEQELVAEFENAPAEVLSNTRLAVPTRPIAFNAVTHGLSGQHIILAAEEIPYFAQMGLDYMLELKPVGVREMSNAQLIFEARWRLHRILSVETDLFIYRRPEPADEQAVPARKRSRRPGYERQVNAFREEARNIEVISRYETRIIRNSMRVTDELEKLQKERAVTEPSLRFNKEASPAVIWYRKILTRCEKLAQARKDFEEYEAARNTAIAPASVKQEPDESQIRAKSSDPSGNPFGKNPLSSSSEPLERTADRPEHQEKWPDSSPNRRKHAA